MRSVAVALIFLGLCVAPAASESLSSGISQNPIRRVVTMLQNMAKKIEDEGEEEKVLYDKFMCYCQTTQGKLNTQIAAEESKLPKLKSARDQTLSTVKESEESLKDHRADRESAKKAMAEATASREASRKKLAAEMAEAKAYVDTLDKAIPAITGKTANPAFLQSTSGAKLQQAILQSSSVSDYDRNLLVSALTGQTEEGDSYNPHGGEISGILETMREDFDKTYNEVKSEDDDAEAVYRELISAKKKEVATLSDAIDKEVTLIGDSKVRAQHLKKEIAEISEGLAKDYSLKKQLDKQCDAKPKEWESRKEARQQEIVAIQETIKILNDDDALELFKKTLPSPSLLQMTTNKKQVMREAAKIIRSLPRELRKQFPALDFLSLKLMGKKADFSEVSHMIDNMVKILKEEQTADFAKKEECRDELNTAANKKRQLEAEISDLQESIEERKQNIEGMKDSIREAKQQIEDLDEDVEQATTQRKSEHAEYIKSLATNQAAKELLGVAESRLNKFYNPKLFALTSTTTPAPDDFSFLQQSALFRAGVSAHEQQEPEGFDRLQKKESENAGVLALISGLIADLQKQMEEAKIEEEDAQKEYEATMGDSAEKRGETMRFIATQESAVADEESSKSGAEQRARKEMKILEEEMKLIAATHADCDFLVTNFDIRKQARTEEMESLEKAKTILAGADFSFVQDHKIAHGNLRGH